MALNLYEPPGAAPGERRFKVFTLGAALSLSEVLPVLQRMGVEVVDERPYVFERSGGRGRSPLRLRPALRPGAVALTRGGHRSGDVALGRRRRLRGSSRTRSARCGPATPSPTASTPWCRWPGSPGGRSSVLRAYAKYLRQAGSTFSQDYVEQCLVANLSITRPLVRLFEARLDPACGGDRDERPTAARRARSRRSSTTWRASTRTGSCARSSR